MKYWLFILVLILGCTHCFAQQLLIIGVGYPLIALGK